MNAKTEPLALCRACTFSGLCISNGWNACRAHALNGSLWRRWRLIEFYQDVIEAVKNDATVITKRMRCRPQDV
jgi:hypothetical protein